ncbi:hypothetical protein N7468_006418 [Penicillium chermesinum]|uniref:Zn(2)-C6 fungal-type domain-containing protein n=1 Tax=Penicillium chermesinum TaxID=63820 RepID=A0A9W9NSM8_9EURO|nr:uncharacterized protein N7468_006418 [Penicillium chermesinum]KAJ5225193.1 hypothetical protein N7468_006418 [Penicillium chermesinum]KAJ6140507.1 hypothetical protein N7470_010303 [Penicillium chermesinum]
MSDTKSSGAGPQHPPSQPKMQRILACVNCQQRKVKCNRQFPCANCLRLKTQCVPATQTRPRKRRFPERELLGRLRQYEDLLRQNNVPFDPLHKEQGPTANGEDDESDDEQLADAAPSASTPSTSPKDIWRAMSGGFPTPNPGYALTESAPESAVKVSWDQSFQSDDHIILTSRKELVDISTLHPEPVHIFRLWQIYLENVNPLLMVTHHPSLQSKIIEAASNTSNLNAHLEALMFSIYSMAVGSLPAAECEALFALSRDDLLTRYQFGCQQALLNCRFLRTDNRDCLTAYLLFLVSLHARMHPRSLGSMLAIAVSIAQRMGIHNESDLARCTPFEAEMRRRLWWALVCFDARIGELSESKTSILNPTWDCRVPLNVNESSLWPEMKVPPSPRGDATETMFIVTRSEHAEYVRNAPFHCEFSNPAMKLLTKSYGEMNTFENKIHHQYLQFCDEGNSLHCMAVWMSHVQLSKSHLLESYAKNMDAAKHLTGSQIESGIQHAFRMLECDTKMLTSSLTKGYTWIISFYFPFPAYAHIVQELVARPAGKHAERAWEIMNSNYEARFASEDTPVDGLFGVFSGVVLKAWEVLEKVASDAGEQKAPPKIVRSINRRIHKSTQRAANAPAVPNNGVATDLSTTPQSMPVDGSEYMFYGMGEPSNIPWVDPRMLANMGPGQPSGPDMSHLNWASMVWGLRNGRGW